MRGVTRGTVTEAVTSHPSEAFEPPAGPYGVDMESLLRPVTSADFLSAMAPLLDMPIIYLDFLPQFRTSTGQEEVLNVSKARLEDPMADCWALTLH